MNNPIRRLPFRMPRNLWLVLLAATVAGISGVVMSNSSPPLVDLATEPLYMNGAKSKANLTIALSVEFPTVGQTYRDTDFDAAKEYIGYFDPKVCYRHVPGNGNRGAYFDWTNKAPEADGSCGGGGFNGNFMNWATSSAIDILRYGLTGGNRVLDDANTTVVERAWLPDSFYNSSAYFGMKRVTKDVALKMTELKTNQITGTHLYIYNCKNRVYFSTIQETGIGSCDKPHNIDVASNDFLIGSTNNQKFYEVRNLICDSNSATNREMLYNAETKEWKGLCYKYPNGKYKPVGQFQVNSESLRVAVLGYLNDDDKARYGGVLRAPMKYLGPKAFDASFNLISGTNPRAEWDVTSGVLVANPQLGDATYGDQGYGQSGAINYINKFGTLNPGTVGKYKTHDPVSELYYEALRYLQGKQPTPNATSGITGTASTDKGLTENFPVYSTWADPFAGFSDTTGGSESCLRNSILSIADVFTHADHSVPGNSVDHYGDYVRNAETGPALSVPFWSDVVGAFESHTSKTYTDSRGRSQTTSNLSGNTVYNGLAGAGSQNTGAGTGSYHMAGLAYWAHTQPFNSNFPKARVTTYSIDVNENRSSDSASFRRQRQLYLAAKYGGFDDARADNTGNPYKPGSNVLWIGPDGDAKNYFLVSDAKKFLDSLAEIFARVVAETGSIAGGAISTTRLTASESAAVYQARFNPVANYWSGRVQKFGISVSTTTPNTIDIGSSPMWEAGQVLTSATRTDHGASRNIVIGAPAGQQGLIAPSNFKWAELTVAHKTALNSGPTGVDTLGEKRLNWLRGDQRDELSSANQAGIFRPRDIVLGDVVNSGLVYLGKPSLNTPGAAFKTFYDANKNRKPVVFVNANDGMLHAFFDENGREAFAYVPGFLAGKLKELPNRDYAHISLADSTPAVGDAFYRSAWRTTLVSGVGGGAQGVYALDVTNAESFTKDNVLWEFTDRDHPAMGNVIGAPQILKFRVTNSGSTTPTYKWFAVVASGVNNYANDGRQHANGNPSLFFLDLGFVPSATQGWVEGTNFWRIELPQSSTAMAKGLSGFSVLRNGVTGAVDAIYAGDLQGNMWKLSFKAKGTTQLGTSATTNFTTFNAFGSAPLFLAKQGTAAAQPITTEPTLINGYGGELLVAFGTGKFLETSDTTVPLVPTASFYVISDNSNSAVSGIAALEKGTVNSSTGAVSVPAFNFGTKRGWYIDLDPAIAERQIGGITLVGGKLVFGTLYPTKGSCGEGGGRLYVLDALTGAGKSEESRVGVLAAPLVVNMNAASLQRSDTTGQRLTTETLGVITQGSKGLAQASITQTYSYQTGRLSWRQVHNHRAP